MVHHAIPTRLAFSLIELLVTLAIVAALTMLAFSAMGAMRRYHEGVTCAQRLRAVGTAIFAYAADHRNRILPRSLGLMRPAGEARPAGNDVAWPNRLVRRGYASPDVFYCPSFRPKRNNLATNPLPDAGRTETYGIRVWIAPGETGFGTNITREEEKPLSAIAQPADFFLVADSYWSAWKSQGYGLVPGNANEQFIHLRHSGKANALFADGHVEAKPGSYFRELHLTERQAAYTGESNLPFGVIEKVE